MPDSPPPSHDTAAIAALLLRLSPAYAPTPLLDLPRLAAGLGVAQALVKYEGQRMLGSFKSLGGTYAGLRALARHAGTDIAGLIAAKPKGLPALLCASDGNHGLAVAAAARMTGGPARIYLHSGVPAIRAARIEAEGGEIAWVHGTYDDAVDAAARSAREGGGILVADTTDDPGDPVVGDVMAGYGVMAAEIRGAVDAAGGPRPTHLFVQAGVGGLAAAMAAGMQGWLAPPAIVMAVEPAMAPSVSAAIAAGRAVRVAGTLETAAEMLSCGEASVPALAVLQRHGARSIAPGLLRAAGGPCTTPSGAAGLAGVVTALADVAMATALGLGAQSRVLLLATEADLAD